MTQQIDGHFGGQWVGATQGLAAAAHIWEIRQTGAHLQIATRWEGQSQVTPLRGQLLPDGSGFAIDDGRFRGFLIGPQHFVVPEWDTNDVRGGVGPAYDVVFARAGIAELAVPVAYRRYLKAAGRA